MKTLMTLLALMLTLTAFSTTGEPKTEKLDVSEFFLSTSLVEYSLYTIDSDGGRELVEVGTNLKKYHFKLDVGKSYVVVFTKGDLSKSLYVDVDHAGFIELDVNFNSVYWARISYDKDKKDYLIKAFKPNE